MMTKKKDIYSSICLPLLFIAAILFTFTACGDDDDDDEVDAYEEEASGGSINGYSYVDLGLSVVWATCNVGADSPEDYGDYYAWGETSTKSSYTEDNSETFGEDFISDVGGESDYDAATALWGSTWRMPSDEELEELVDDCTWTWTELNGTEGFNVTASNGNSIFLPAGGWYDESSLEYEGERCYYWTSTPLWVYAYYAYGLYADEEGIEVGVTSRYVGQLIRPVSEDPD